MVLAFPFSLGMRFLSGSRNGSFLLASCDGLTPTGIFPWAL
jgi:hypothetical protein